LRIVECPFAMYGCQETQITHQLMGQHLQEAKMEHILCKVS
jgi:hypothetical protein